MTGDPAKAGGNAPAFEPLDAVQAVEGIEGGATGAMPTATPLTFPGPIAEAFFYDDRPVVGICGPVGSGKTTTLMLSRIRRAVQMPRSVIDGVRRYKLVVVRETYRQLWATTIPSYLETVPKALGNWSGGRGAPVTHAVAFEDDFGPIEWTAEFLAFGDDIVASMRGIQTTDLWLSEADTNPVETLTTGVGRVNRWPGQRHFVGYADQYRTYGQIVCDQNAPEPDNWTVGVFFDEAGRLRMAAELGINIGFHRQPGGRSPGAENAANLPPGYYETQIATMTLAGRGDMIARLVDSRITHMRAGDPVFKREYAPHIHLRPRIEPDPSLPLMIGLDQGFIGAAVIGQFREPFHWRFLADMMFPKERLFAREFGFRLRDLLDSPRFAGLTVEGAWGDIAGETGASQAAEENATWNMLVGKTAGITVRPQRIGANRVQPRLEAVRAALEYLHGGEPGLVIDEAHCRFLPAAFEARYVWKDEIDARGDKRKLPNKSIVEANVMDAAQYLMLSKVKGSGMSPVSVPGAAPWPPLRQGDASQAAMGGLKTGYDVLNPYAGRRA